MAMKKEEMIEAKKLNPVDFLAKVLEAEKHTDHICWKCKYLKWVLEGLRFSPGRHHRLVQENPLAPLLVHLGNGCD